MGYILHAFIGKQSDLLPITGKYSQAKMITLEQGIGIIPMTEELYDEINNFVVSDDILTLAYLNNNIESRVLELIGNSMVGYIEAEYVGGEGGQSAVLWKNGSRSSLIPFGNAAINSVLSSLGVTVVNGRDEFDTLGLGRHRSTGEWFET